MKELNVHRGGQQIIAVSFGRLPAPIGRPVSGPDGRRAGLHVEEAGTDLKLTGSSRSDGSGGEGVGGER